MLQQLDPDSLLLTSDVARICSVSGETVRAWARAGRISAKRTLGGVRLFTAEDVMRLHAQRAEPTDVLEAAAAR